MKTNVKSVLFPWLDLIRTAWAEIKWYIDNFWPSIVCTLVQSVSGICWIEMAWTCFPHMPNFSSAERNFKKWSQVRSKMITSHMITKLMITYTSGLWLFLGVPPRIITSKPFEIEACPNRWRFNLPNQGFRIQELTAPRAVKSGYSPMISGNQFLIKSIHRFYILLLHPIHMAIGNDNDRQM